MKKGKIIFFSALLMSCFLAVPTEAKSVEKILTVYAKMIFLLTMIN